MNIARPLLGGFLLALPLGAQDLLGFGFSGNAVGASSSFPALSAPLGSPFSGCQGAARRAGTVWVSEQTGHGTAAQFHLSTYDEQTDLGTRVFPNTGFDVRALASQIHAGLFAIVQGPTSDVLMTVNTTTGAFATVGNLGFANVQGLTRVAGLLYAWDATAGLLRVATTTGVATDVDPGLGTGGADLQFLCTMSDGRVIGGCSSLYEVDLQTGALTFLGGMPIAPDLRGAEEHFGSTNRFGVGCTGATFQVVLSANGEPYVGQAYSVFSGAHAAGSPALLCFGFSRTSYQGTALPFLVDPLLGTSGCRLYVAPDVLQFGLVNAGGSFVTPIAVPSGLAGLVCHAQHAALENVGPGRWSFSNGVEIRIGF